MFESKKSLEGSWYTSIGFILLLDENSQFEIEKTK